MMRPKYKQLYHEKLSKLSMPPEIQIRINPIISQNKLLLKFNVMNREQSLEWTGSEAKEKMEFLQGGGQIICRTVDDYGNHFNVCLVTDAYSEKLPAVSGWTL